MATKSTQDALAALADATGIDWLQHLIEAQANFTREVGNLYASSARGLYKQ
jgi:hypothetical protein